MSLKSKFSFNARHVRWIALALILLGLILLCVWGARVYGAARSLLSRLPEAQALMADDPLMADSQAIGALVHGVRADFVSLKRDVGWGARIAPAFRWLPKVGPVLGDAPAYLGLADASTELGVLMWDDAAPGLAAFQQGQPISDVLRIVLPAIVEDVPQSRILVHRIQAAYAEIDATMLPERFQGLFLKMGELLPFADMGLDWLEHTPYLLGLDEERTYLVLALNDDELRPAGGFITGVGEVRILGGQLVSMEFMDSYKADDFSQPYPDPPEPLRRFMGLDLWVFRDSNWSPDFPTAARQAIDLYRPRRAETHASVMVRGIVAIDQYAARNIINAMGPIKIEGADDPITGDTLLDFIYRTWENTESESYGGWWKNRKAFMGILAEAALDRMASGQVDLVDLVNTVREMFAQKHLMLYFPDDDITSLVAAYGWDGALPQLQQDYVSIIEANVGYNKTSASIERAFTYEVDLTQPLPTALLVMTYTHTSQADVTCKLEPRYDDEYVQMQNRCYWEYLRVYTPEGAELLASSMHPIPTKHIAIREPWYGYADSAIAPEGAWTIFSQALLLMPKEEDVVRFKYTLPPTVISQGEDGLFTYRLIWAKQAGLQTVPARVILRMPRSAVLLSASLIQNPFGYSQSQQTSDDMPTSEQPLPAVADDGVLLYEVDMNTDWALDVVYRLEQTQ